MTQKSLIKMQISPIKNPNFEKSPRKPIYKDQSEDLEKKNFGISLKKICFRVCSVTAEMFEHRNMAKIEGKEAKFFSKIYQGVPLISLCSTCQREKV